MNAEPVAPVRVNASFLALQEGAEAAQGELG